MQSMAAKPGLLSIQGVVAALQQETTLAEDRTLQPGYRRCTDERESCRL